MPRAKTPPATAPAAPKAAPETSPKWTPAELLAVKHLGPAIIGQEKYDAAQSYIATTNGGQFGPAILGDPAFSQAGPIRVDKGVPVFAESAP